LSDFTSSKKWFADPASPNLVNLNGLGGPSGDAARFGIGEIPMIFANETTPLNESYDFFFYVHAPDTPGTYTPQSGRMHRQGCSEKSPAQR
jgi:hypothetical protein